MRGTILSLLLSLSLVAYSGVKSNDMDLYPNPASDKVTLVYKSSSDELVTSLKVYNIIGTKVLDIKLVDSSFLEEEINLSRLENGIYFFNLYS